MAEPRTLYVTANEEDRKVLLTCIAEQPVFAGRQTMFVITLGEEPKGRFDHVFVGAETYKGIVADEDIRNWWRNSIVARLVLGGKVEIVR